MRVRVCVPYIYKIKIKKIIYYIELRYTLPRRVGENPASKSEKQPGCGLRFYISQYGYAASFAWKNVAVSEYSLGKVLRWLVYSLGKVYFCTQTNQSYKYADDADKPRIRECFESIPKQLAKDNKKFQYSVVRKGGRSSQYIGSVQWLEDAGIVRRCYNIRITELPLEGNSMKDCFKLYTADIGLLVAMLDYGTQTDILKGNLLGYKGAIFENLMADFLCKSGQKLYYFQKESGLELDFVVRFKGECVVLEVKAKSGKTKSLKTVLKNKSVYHVNNAIKLGKYNVGREEEILTIPLYMGFLVKDKLTEIIVPDIDWSLLN